MGESDIFETESVRLHQGEALRFPEGLETETVDAVITDPPYSSGGRTSGSRAQPPAKKYVHTESRRFAGGAFFGLLRVGVAVALAVGHLPLAPVA